jgi:hypothetical protein
MATLIAGNYDFVDADAAFEQYLQATGLSAEHTGTVNPSIDLSRTPVTFLLIFQKNMAFLSLEYDN